LVNPTLISRFISRLYSGHVPYSSLDFFSSRNQDRPCDVGVEIRPAPAVGNLADGL
jgi:hypothetical protein